MELPSRSLQLIGPLGTGDLATVYRASDPDDGARPVAAASFHTDLKDLEGVLRIVKARVDACEDLIHPGIAAQEGLFLVSGQPTLVMELVAGVDLVRLASQGPVPAPIAAAIIHTAAQTLAALLADPGLVHGLLTPRRVVLTADGSVKLLGLGVISGSVEPSGPLASEGREGAQYIAPEQGAVEPFSAADVYAMGAMLSWMLTGAAPMRSSDKADAQAEVAADAARRVAEQADTEGLGAVVASCMSSDPESRPSMDELVAALSDYSADLEALQSWAGEVVPELGGEILEGLEARYAEDAAAADDEMPLVLGALGPPDTEEERLRPVSPDDETDLQKDIDTDEKPDPAAPQVAVDEGADKWDQMLGLDVIPDVDADEEQDLEVASDGGGRAARMWLLLCLVAVLGISWQLELVPAWWRDADVPASLPALDLPVPPPAPVESASVMPESAPNPTVEETSEPALPALSPAPVVPAAPASEPVPATPVPPELPPVPVENAAPEPATPTAPPPPQTALVYVAGDAHRVHLIHGGRRYSAGRMPPGAYHVEVIFKSGEKARVASRITLEAGDRRVVECSAIFYRCVVR